MKNDNNIISNSKYDFKGEYYNSLYPNLHKYPATMLPQIGLKLLKEFKAKLNYIEADILNIEKDKLKNRISKKNYNKNYEMLKSKIINNIKNIEFSLLINATIDINKKFLVRLFFQILPRVHADDINILRHRNICISRGIFLCKRRILCKY